MKKLSVYQMSVCALMAAVLCVLAPHSINIGPIPLSLATFVVYLSAYLLGPIGSTISVLIYLLLGAFGVPVFSNYGSGFAKLAGPTGGYLVGYLALSLIGGFFIIKAGKKVWLAVIGMVIATAVLYILGTAWFMFQSGNDLVTSLGLCVTPFLLGDAIKIAIASILGLPVRYALKKAGLLTSF